VEINPDECYVRGSGYKDIPGDESNPDKGASTAEDDTNEYSVEDEEEVDVDEAPKSKKQQKPRR
jgi:hypothetical protein